MNDVTEPFSADLLWNLGGRIDLDAHAHVFDFTAQAAEGSRYLPDYAAPLSEWMIHLQQNGMTGGTLVQPSFLGTDNQQLLRAVEKARSLGLAVTGSAVVPPDASDDLLQELAALNIISLRLNWIGESLPQNATAIADQLACRAAEAGLAVELHLEAERAAQACRAITSQGATLILDHYGLAETKTQLLALLESCGDGASLFVKASGAYRLPTEPSNQRDLAECLLNTAVGMIGMDRILWGTDWPHTRHERTANFARAMAANKNLLALMTEIER